MMHGDGSVLNPLYEPGDRMGPLYPRHVVQGDQGLSIFCFLCFLFSLPFSFFIIMTALTTYDVLALNMALDFNGA